MKNVVPIWDELSLHTQKALKESKYDAKWFEENKDEKIRLTVLNLYVKMSGLNLWKYVNQPSSISIGCLEFLTNDVLGFKAELNKLWNFRTPEASMKEWDSAEKRWTGALHFKHFAGSTDMPWPINKVQAHIDQAGNWLGNSALWWAGQPITGIRHLIKYDSYKDVFGIRDILLEQGWDRQTLIGIKP